MFWNPFALKLPYLPLERLRLSLSIDLLLVTPPSPLLSNTINFSSFLPTYWPLCWTPTLKYIFSAISTLMYLNTLIANKLVNL